MRKKATSRGEGLRYHFWSGEDGVSVMLSPCGTVSVSVYTDPFCFGDYRASWTHTIGVHTWSESGHR